MTKSRDPETDSSQDIIRKRSLPSEPDWWALLATLVGGGVCALLVYRAPFLGHDWMVAFASEVVDAQYPPWVTLLLRPLTSLPPRTGLAIVNGLTLSSVSVLAYRYGRHTFPETRAPAILALIFALLNPIPWMLLWLGQIEAMVTVGLTVLPIGIPLLFAKPHMGPWAALGSRRDLLCMILLLVISLGIWGLWPRSVLAHVYTHRIPHPTSIGWRTIHPILGLIGVVLLLATPRDPLRLIAAGTLISPFVMPYHYYILLPALGRTRGYRQLALWLISWTTIAAVGIQTVAVKAIAATFPGLVWVLLARELRPSALLANPDILVNRIRSTFGTVQGWFE
jgi:hypothetical protein